MELDNTRYMNQLTCFTEVLRELKNLNYTGSSTLEKVANNILSYLLKLTQAQTGMLAVITNQKAAKVASTSNTITIDEEEIAWLYHASEPVTYLHNRNIMLIPLKIKKISSGLIKLIKSEPFTDKDLRYAAYLSYFAAMAVERAKVKTGITLEI